MPYPDPDLTCQSIEVPVGPHHYTVIQCDNVIYANGHEAIGKCDTDRLAILIAARLPPSRKLATLRYELVLARWPQLGRRDDETGGIGFCSYLTEVVISSITPQTWFEVHSFFGLDANGQGQGEAEASEPALAATAESA